MSKPKYFSSHFNLWKSPTNKPRWTGPRTALHRSGCSLLDAPPLEAGRAPWGHRSTYSITEVRLNERPGLECGIPPRLPTPCTIPRAFNVLHLLPPNVMATAAVKVNHTPVNVTCSREPVGRTRQTGHPTHCAPLGTPSRHTGQRLLRVLWGPALSAQPSTPSIAFSSMHPAGPVNASTTLDTKHAGIRTHTHGRSPSTNCQPRRHVYGKDDLIITKVRRYKTCHAMPLQQPQLDRHPHRRHHLR
jgi:hypothetical protein